MNDVAQSTGPLPASDSADPPGAPFEARRFREALGHYPTGVAVITWMTDDGPVGTVVNSFTSVSLDPPLVAFVPQRTSGPPERPRTGSSFCVNVLAADQEQLCRALASRGESAFAGVGWTRAPSGAPRLDNVVAWVACTVESAVDAGDRHIVIGRVQAVDVVRPSLPLLLFQGGYGRFTLSSLMAGTEPDLVQGIRLAEHARDQIEAVAEELKAECSVMTPVGEDSVFVAIANRSTEPSRVTLGSRVPLIPPIGAVFISHLGSVAVNEWLSRLPGADDATQEAYVRQLERVRERGYSISLRGSHTDSDIHAMISDYSSPDRLPEHVRRFRTLIQETAPLYEPDIGLDGTYDLHSIVVPVPGPMGLVQIAIRLAGVPGDASGREVLAWAERLQQAASVVSGRLDEVITHTPLTEGAPGG